MCFFKIIKSINVYELYFISSIKVKNKYRYVNDNKRTKEFDSEITSYIYIK